MVQMDGKVQVGDGRELAEDRRGSTNTIQLYHYYYTLFPCVPNWLTRFLLYRRLQKKNPVFEAQATMEEDGSMTRNTVRDWEGSGE